jgi:hypothetical protein
MKPAIAFLFLACLLAACVKVDGGAVEISWVIRSRSGSAITDCGCSSPSIATVRLRLVLASSVDGGAIIGADGGTVDRCAGNAQCDFPCARQTGSTPFNIPETHGTERYAVSLVAVGADGRELPDVDTPAPILREVVRGQPTEVESVQLVAGCATECQMNSSGVCTRP